MWTPLEYQPLGLILKILPGVRLEIIMREVVIIRAHLSFFCASPIHPFVQQFLVLTYLFRSFA